MAFRNSISLEEGLNCKNKYWILGTLNLSMCAFKQKQKKNFFCGGDGCGRGGDCGDVISDKYVAVISINYLTVISSTLIMWPVLANGRPWDKFHWERKCFPSHYTNIVGIRLIFSKNTLDHVFNFRVRKPTHINR